MSSIASNFAWIAKQDPHNILAILVYQSSKCLCEVASFGRTNLLICLITVIRSCINKICYLGPLFPNKILSKNIITIPLNNLLVIISKSILPILFMCSSYKLLDPHPHDLSLLLCIMTSIIVFPIAFQAAQYCILRCLEKGVALLCP